MHSPCRKKKIPFGKSRLNDVCDSEKHRNSQFYVGKHVVICLMRHSVDGSLGNKECADQIFHLQSNE